jgi:peroxiredoxin Q/BCP
MSTLTVGKRAPAFRLRDQRGREVSLSDFAGRKLLVFFYPKADTPGCTKQACSVRDASAVLKALDVAAIGISPDKPDMQGKFDHKFNLGFPLLSDVEHTVAEAWGVWAEKSMYGRTYMGIVRSSFLVDEDGKVAAAWYGVKPQETVPKAVEALKGGVRKNAG